MKYTVSYSFTVKLLTAFVFLFFAGITAMQFYGPSAAGGAFRYIIPLFFIVLLLVVWGFSTTGYEITNQELIIKRPFSNVTVSKDNIHSVEALDKDSLKWTIRTFGSGGLFGHYGKFYNKQLGHMTWYATDLNKSVLIKTKNDKKFVITPDERKKFVYTLKQNL